MPLHPDNRRGKDRNRVERMFGALKRQRRIAVLYDKALVSTESFLNLAAMRLRLRPFVNTVKAQCCLSIKHLRYNRVLTFSAQFAS